MNLDIPGFGHLDIRHIVCDYNGTIAKDGIVLPSIGPLFDALSERFSLHVITADTFGSVKDQLATRNVKIEILESDDHTREKADFIRSLGADRCVAIGNGNNDLRMLKASKLGIAIVGEEGCSGRTLSVADLVCRDVSDALELFLYPKRLVATLRC
ncbi:HAD family hydrolase [Hydrogenimonas sp.]